MRTIDNLSNKSKIEKAWSLNNSVMVHEPESTLAATNRVVHILDANYEKAGEWLQGCSLLFFINIL